MSVHNLFVRLFNMSISASYLVLAVLVARLLLKKAPKWVNCVLWAFVGVRLVCPFSLISTLSILPSANFLPLELVNSSSSFAPTAADIFKHAFNNHVHYSLGVSDGSLTFTEISAPDGDFLNPLLIITYIASVVWLAGMATMIIHGIASYLRLKKQVGASVLFRDNAYYCDEIASPFILGFFKPLIFLPSTINEADLQNVLLHENAHLQRRDYLSKPLGYVLLCVYWFNPLMWVAYALMCRDIELACDERVIRTMSMADKKSYSVSLLSCSVQHYSLAACPLAFGEVGVKERIKNVIKYKKPTAMVIAATLMVCIVIGIVFLTNPVSTAIDGETEAYLHQVILEHGRQDGSEDVFPTEAHRILKAENKNGVTTAYVLVAYQEYYTDGESISSGSGFISPLVITLDMTGFGYSSMVWKPGMGTDYVDDIREKFPWYLQNKVIHNEKLHKTLLAECRSQAEKHFDMEYVDPYETYVWTTVASTASPPRTTSAP